VRSVARSRTRASSVRTCRWHVLGTSGDQFSGLALRQFGAIARQFGTDERQFSAARPDFVRLADQFSTLTAISSGAGADWFWRQR